MRERHPKSDPARACCWICGEPGGVIAPFSLKNLGYKVRTYNSAEQARAHSTCIEDARIKQRSRNT